jgi:hypothetical protein
MSDKIDQDITFNRRKLMTRPGEEDGNDFATELGGQANRIL